MQPYLNLTRWFMQKKIRPKRIFDPNFFSNPKFFPNPDFFSDQIFFSDQNFFPTNFFRQIFFPDQNYFGSTFFIPTKTSTITILTKLYMFWDLESGTGDWGSGTWDLGSRLLLTNWPFWPIWCGPVLSDFHNFNDNFLKTLNNVVSI